MKKKVIIFHSTIAPYRIKFFNELAKSFDTKVCLYYENLKDQKFDYDAISSQFQFVPDYFDRHVNVLGREFYIGHMKRIKEYNPDIVIVPEYGEALWSTIMLKKLKGYQYKIVTMCDDSLAYAAECSGVRKVSRELAMRSIDGIILCNNQAEQWYNEHYNVKTFNFPIIQDEQDYRLNIDSIIDSAKNLHVLYNLTGKRVFLYVGRIAPEKNLEYLISSFIADHDKHPENRLFIVGSAIDKCKQYEENIINLIHSGNAGDYIKCVGRKEGDELKSWYALAQILVLPSKAEPFGTVVDEALIMGEYVMVSKYAGSCCLVDDDNGEIIDVDNKHISFDDVCAKIRVMGDRIEIRDSMMGIRFHTIMTGFIKWLEI